MSAPTVISTIQTTVSTALGCSWFVDQMSDGSQVVRFAWNDGVVPADDQIAQAATLTTRYQAVVDLAIQIPTQVLLGFLLYDKLYPWGDSTNQWIKDQLPGFLPQ